MRRLQTIFSAFIVSFIFLSFVIVPKTLAAPTTSTTCTSGSSNDTACIAEILQKTKSIQDYGKEFCDKRSGDLMNLETWFSGKCGPGIDTLSGEGVGFSDIIILQGIETLIGPQQEGLLAQLSGLVKMLGDIRKVIRADNNQTLGQKLAIIKSEYPNNQGLLSQVSNLSTTLLLSKPAGTSEYLAYVTSNLQKHHIINQAYAASPGYGFTALSPILPIWRAFRNVSYLLFALVFVMYGVMIMLRIKIDSKTAATIQLAIPKLIATLLLITFSYAIVGLLVDISTIVTALAVNILAVGDKNLLSLGGFGTNLVGFAGGTQFGAFGSFIVNALATILVAPFVMISFLFAPYAAITGSILMLVGAPWGSIIAVILIVIVLFSYIKLIFKLFEAFISIIVNLIFAPIILLGNVMPGSDAFGSWMRSIYGNLAVFPTAVFFLTLSYALLVQPFFGIIKDLSAYVPPLKQINMTDLSDLLGVNPLATTGGLWAPPMTFAFGIQGDIMLATIGFGLLLMSSKYVDMVRDALKVPPFKYGSAIGDALKLGWKQSGAIPSVGNQSWYKGVSKVTGLQAGTPWTTPPPAPVPPVAPLTP